MMFQVQVQVDISALPLPRCMTLADVHYLPGMMSVLISKMQIILVLFLPCHFEMVYIKHLEQCLGIIDSVTCYCHGCVRKGSGE